MWSFWIHHWVLLLLTGHAWFLKLKKSFQLQMAYLQLHSNMHTTLVFFTGHWWKGVLFSMIVAHCLGDLDALSNYDPLLFLHCCSYVVEDCSHRTLYLPACNVLYAEIQFVLTIERGIVKPEFGPKFAFSSTSRLGSLVSDLRLPPYLNLLTKVMKGNWLCFTRRNL